ncbi:MAG: hypothetical protein V9G20_05970 [Candidatus Promineifilaceae bacterium]
MSNTRKVWNVPDSPAPLADIDAGLAAGSLVVVNVDRDAKDTTFSPADGHWVVIHKKQGSDYLIWDPYKSEGASETLIGRYGFGFKNAAQIIKQAIWFGTGDFPAQGTPSTPTQPATPKPPTTPTTPNTPPAGGKLTVRTTGDQVSLRSQPVVSTNTLIRSMPKGTVLEVTEGGNAAAKIGAQNRVAQSQGQRRQRRVCGGLVCCLIVSKGSLKIKLGGAVRRPATAKGRGEIHRRGLGRSPPNRAEKNSPPLGRDEERGPLNSYPICNDIASREKPGFCLGQLIPYKGKPRFLRCIVTPFLE